MQPLETNQLVLTWLYAFPSDQSATKWKKVAYFMFTASVIFILFSGVTSGGFFISKFMRFNLEEAIYALFYTIAFSNILYQSVATVLLRKKLQAIFKSLSKIYDDNKSEDSYQILVETSRKCEWMWSIFMKYIFCGILVIGVTMYVVSALYCYIYYGHFRVDHVYHGIRTILPWNQSTPLGYFFEFLFILCCSGAYLFTNGSIIILFISMSLHHGAFYKMFRNEVKKLDFHIRTRNDAEHLRKLICFHTSVKDWFLETAAVLSPFISVVLISNMLVLSCAVFQFDLQMKNPDYGLVTIIVTIPFLFSILFVYCYFGKTATESFGKMSGCLYDCNWRNLSLKHQKYLIIMIQNAQRPIHYHGFGIAVLNLETFTMMINAVYSYYMIFKTLTSH